MSYRFPFEKIDKGERIIIYGAGPIGQEFYWQVRDGAFCKVVGIADRRFHENSGVLIKPEAIKDVTFDKILIASDVVENVLEISGFLLKMDIPRDKIISGFIFDYPKIDANLDAELFYERFGFYDKLLSDSSESDSEFSGNCIYQSYKKIGIEGRRDTEERLKAYELPRFLDHETTVLDIGCNCGFLDMQIADCVKRIKGIDVEKSVIDVAKHVSEYLNIHNVIFENKNLFEQDNEDIYDVVFAFAIHKPVIETYGISEKRFAELLLKHINKGGYLFMESHGYREFNEDQTFFDIIEILKANNMKLVLYKHNYGTQNGNMNRDIAVLKKY